MNQSHWQGRFNVSARLGLWLTHRHRQQRREVVHHRLSGDNEVGRPRGLTRDTKPQLLREQTAHLLAALHSEGIEALAAQPQQLFPLGVAQFLPAHQSVGALLVAGDAVEGEPCPPSA